MEYLEQPDAPEKNTPTLWRRVLGVTFYLLFACLALAASVTIQPGQETFTWILLAVFFVVAIIIKPNHLFIRIIFFSFSAFITLRYLLFRGFYTLVPIEPISFAFAILLFLTECYAIFIHFLGLFVGLAPRDRPTPPLPNTLPTIDVFIPTFNENISVALNTAIACKNFDYPQDLVNVYILDDGSRLPRMNTKSLEEQLIKRHQSLKEEAQKIGVKYLTRADEEMAKAGMINAAFNGKAFSDIIKAPSGEYIAGTPITTTGELILILDCDHIPSRDMPAKVVGHFSDKRVFLAQTPHFMLNPDPMRKNWGDEQHLPCESWLFYQQVQRGLDRWNAAFFCGSAAFLRRSMLAENNGLSGETITEDCETALNMHSKGYHSVYVSSPHIAGLAPESFTDMIKQRQRWCQGMIQILLLKTPLFKRGLTLPQRLCYMNSCLFWLFPLFRIVFLMAPLMFLLFGLNIYNASIDQVLAYALPHMISSAFLAATIHGKLRPFLHSEVLETLQSFFLLPAIVSVLIAPKKPVFHTTRKGITLDKDFLSPLALPFIITFILLLCGFVAGVATWYTNPLLRNTLYIALLWNTYNMAIIICCLGAVWERKQLRSAHRINLAEPISINGFPGTLTSLSLTGLRVATSHAPEFKQGESYVFSAPKLISDIQVVRTGVKEITAIFSPKTSQRALINYVYGDSSRWQSVINSVVTSKESYAKLSWQLFWAGLHACGITLFNLIRRLIFPVTALFALTLLHSQTAFALSATKTLSSILNEKEYTVASAKGVLRIPFYLSTRTTINTAELTIKYIRSSLFPENERPIYLEIDEQRVEGMVIRSEKKSSGTHPDTIIFDLPVEKMVPGTRVVTLRILQDLPNKSLLPLAKIPNLSEIEQQKLAQNGAYWTTINLKDSTLTVDYDLRELTVGERKDLDFLFDSQVLVPKELHIVLPSVTYPLLTRALHAVRHIAQAVGERPLLVSVSSDISNDKDSLIIADNALELRASSQNNPLYVCLTEEDLPQFNTPKLPVLEPGKEQTLQALGLETLTLYPWTSSRVKTFLIPSFVALTPNRYLRIALNFTYTEGLSKKSFFDVGVNKEILTRIHLDNLQGDTKNTYTVNVPSSLLEKGINSLVITPHLIPFNGNAWDNDYQGLFVTIFNSSSFLLPISGTFVRLPELEYLFTDGYPFNKETAFLLPSLSYDTAAAALNFAALLAQHPGASPEKPLLITTENGAPNKNYIEFIINPLTPKNTFILSSSLIQTDEKLASILKADAQAKVKLSIIASSTKDLLQGTLHLWKPSLQKKLRGSNAIINLATDEVDVSYKRTRIISTLEPFGVITYYVNNYPFTAWAATCALIFLFSIVGYLLAKEPRATRRRYE